MKLEEQVCSLELAKRLRELGARQNSAWAWKEPSAGNEVLVLVEQEVPPEWYAAYSVAELGEMLPAHEYSMTYRYPDGMWETWTCLADEFANHLVRQAEHEADARAKVLIYLLEHSIIELEEVNARPDSKGDSAVG